MKSLGVHIKNNFIAYLLAGIFGIIFFYRLDYSTLTSWDEAWYASIAREMARSGDWIFMKWNGNPYYDHPPMGFWLMALSYKLFGISEFTTRLPSVLCGIGSIVLLYVIGKRISGKKSVGLAASIVLGTSVWYVIRVRSGNLDSPFVFFTILSVYTAILSKDNVRWFPIAMASAGALFMTKTLVGAAIFPLVLYMNIKNIIRIRTTFLFLILGCITLAIVITPWYILHYRTYPDFINHHFFQIGARSKTFSSYFQLYLKEPLFYLHMGVRKWYYIWFIGILGTIWSLIRSKNRIFALFLLLWNGIILYPFLTAPETELWHLIPVYIPMALITAYGISALNPFGEKAYIAGFILIAAIQIRIFAPEVFPANKYIPHDVAISQRAATYGKQIYLDDDFFPICVFYSDRRVLPLYNLASFGEPEEINTMVKLFESEKTDFVVITRSWAVDNLKVAGIPYTLLEDNGSFSIVSRPEKSSL